MTADVVGRSRPWDARAIADGVRQGHWTARAVLEDFLGRIEATNGQIHALVSLRLDQAVADADAVDTAMRRCEPLGPLCGVPFTVKDVLATHDLPTTCGSVPLRDQRTRTDATVVSRLRAAGAILIGKSNCPEFAFGIDTENLLFGRTKNPLGPFIAGGSSGGEAASIAAGFSALGVGTDFGGSVRWPAQCTGIVGLRPTVGRIPATGTLPAWTEDGPFVPAMHTMQGRIQTVGLLGATVADIAAGLEVVAGPDGYDTQTVPVPIRQPASVSLAEVEASGGAWVGGLVPAPAVEAAVNWALDALASRGMAVSAGVPEQLDRAVELYSAIRKADTLGEIEAAVSGRVDELTPLVRSLLIFDHERPERETAGLWAERDKLRGELLAWLRADRVLILPVATQLPLHDHEPTDGGFEVLTPCRAVALFGLPSVSVPCPRAPDGRPVSVQVVGPPFREDLVLAVGSVLEAARAGSQHAGA